MQRNTLFSVYFPFNAFNECIYVVSRIFESRSDCEKKANIMHREKSSFTKWFVCVVCDDERWKETKKKKNVKLNYHSVYFCAVLSVFSSMFSSVLVVIQGLRVFILTSGQWKKRRRRKKGICYNVHVYYFYGNTHIYDKSQQHNKDKTDKK